MLVPQNLSALLDILHNTTHDRELIFVNNILLRARKCYIVTILLLLLYLERLLSYLCVC